MGVPKLGILTETYDLDSATDRETLDKNVANGCMLLSMATTDINDSAHVTRALELLPAAGGHRERLRPILIDDYPDSGGYARHEDIQNVGDLRALGPSGLAQRGVDPADAAWLMAQIGGAKRGRKPREA